MKITHMNIKHNYLVEYYFATTSGFEEEHHNFLNQITQWQLRWKAQRQVKVSTEIKVEPI